MKFLSILAMLATFAIALPAIAEVDDYDGVSGSGSGDRFRADTAEECHPYPLVNGECKWPEGRDGGDSDGGDAGAGESDGGESDGGESDGGESDGGESDGGEGEGEGGEGEGEGQGPY